MGGTGAIPFCGNKNYQFVLSKKHPKIINKDGYWGFTLVRRRRPKEGEKSSVYEYDITERTVATLDLYYSLNRQLFKMSIPIRIIDARDYGGNKISTLTGMSARLQLLIKDFSIEKRSKNHG